LIPLPKGNFKEMKMVYIPSASAFKPFGVDAEGATVKVQVLRFAQDDNGVWLRAQ
jgi:hypothetical protein